MRAMILQDEQAERWDAEGSAREYGTKTCPRCGQMLFADMSVCYGCLYDFRRSEAGYEAQDEEASELPHLEETHVPQISSVAVECAGLRAEDERAGQQAEDAGDTTPLPKKTCVRVAVQDSDEHVSLWIRTGDVDVRVAVPPSGLSIGRGPANDVVLHSQAVSHEHLLVMPQNGGIEVSDLGATNPASFHGRPIDGQVEVPFGEAIDLCGTYIVPQRSLREDMP